jgi:hypothetical protein
MSSPARPQRPEASRADRANAERGHGATIERRHALFGWASLFLYLLFGYTLEVLQGFKVEGFVLHPLRHEFWSLAHFHGALLGLLNVVYASRAAAPGMGSAARRLASGALVAGSLLLPLGFFLGGLVHYEGDPGPGIALVPIGGLFLLYGVGSQALAAWRRRAAGD